MNEGKIAGFQDEINPKDGQKLDFIWKGIVDLHEHYMNHFNERENEFYNILK